MASGLPIKKTVSFQWRGRRLDLDVAQDLFSSFQVDRGSRMLLGSLDPDAFPDTGHAVDFGCGYGVLGIAWQAAQPGWSMAYVDRDALAVAFSQHNLRRAVPEAIARSAFHTDIAVPNRDGGHDLVLWNVPGKAGRPVIAALLDATLDGLAAGGVLAAVVVHPLADLFTDPLERDDVDMTMVERGREHTVVHLRRSGGAVVARDPFVEGAFDRPPHAFATAGLEWSLAPAIGLPEYDSLGHATELAARAMAGYTGPVRSWAVIEPGVGHLAVVARQCWARATGQVAGRDALALRVTERALGGAPGIGFRPIWGAVELAGVTPVDLVVAALPEQAPAEDLAVTLDVLAGLVVIGGALVLHGRSAEISRVERLTRNGGTWRAGRTRKLRGAACLLLARRQDVP